MFFFFFSSRRRHTRCSRDWSSDVCSSDLAYGRRLKRVWEKNLAVRSAYNTYLHTGLPPGPISQPGRASLLAALYPADVPFLYFVAQPDGKHVFSATYDEHLAAIARIKQARRAARA